MARNPRPVAVAKAPKAIPNDEFSSPVLGSAWLPRLCLGSFTSDTLVDAEVDNASDTLVEILVLSEALADSVELTDSEADNDADALALCDSLNDTDSLVEIKEQWK